jgi:hypothetical protein
MYHTLPTNFELVINISIGTKMGISILNSILLRGYKAIDLISR